MGWYEDYKTRVEVLGTNEQEITKSILQEDFNYFMSIAPNKYSVIINNNDTNVIDCIISDKTNIKTQTTEKRLDCSFDSTINQGDYINWYNKNWLLIKEKDIVTKQNKSFRLEYCNQTYKRLSSSGLIEYPCVAKITTSISSVSDSGKDTPIQDYPYMITIQSNEDTIKTNENMRFIFGRNVYKVAKVEDSLSNGILYIYFDVDQKRPLDDFENGIANNNDGYTLDTNIENIVNNVGYTTQIVTSVYKNGELISPQPTVEYNSNDVNIVTVDTNGNVELIAEGNTSIDIKFGNVIKSISVQVNTVPPIETITFAINPLITSLTQFDSAKTIECERYVNGVKDTITPLTITDSPQGFTSGYTFSVNGNSFTLKNDNIAGKTLNVVVDDGLGNSDIFSIRLTAW